MRQILLLFLSLTLATFCYGQGNNPQALPVADERLKVVPAGHPTVSLQGMPEYPGARVDSLLQISQYIRRVFQDRKGNLWMGTNDDGVCRYDGKSLVYFTLKDGFGGKAVRGIAEDKQGGLWFATDGGLSRYDGSSFANFTTKDGLGDNDIRSICIDTAGTLWMGTVAGVYRFDGKSFTDFPIPPADIKEHSSRLNPKLAWSIYEDKAGNMWFGTDGDGVRKYDGKSFTILTAKNGLASNNVCTILEDFRGRMWFGTRDDGVSRYNGSYFTNFTEADGLCSNFSRTMIEDRSGYIWFGTAGGGASRYDGQTFTNFTEREGLTQTHIQSIMEDNRGTLWFGCSGGLFRFAGRDFINVTKNGPWK